MYTQCPECKQPYSITVAELRTSHGMISCETCSAQYDALDLLNEGTIPTELNTGISPPSYTNTPETTPPQSRYWGTGASLLLVVLIFQAYYFEAYNLSQNALLRPWLEKACTKKGNCQLPAYKNLSEISILKGSFEPENNHYIFKTVIINQSLFAQKRPSIKLTLIDFSGRSFASRTFYPTDYSSQPITLLEPNLADEISLSIATPSSNLGGYRFELI
jgi:predicted Zn finger-like uncharacterized protein